MRVELLTLLRTREEEPVWWELLRNERSLDFILGELRKYPKILMQLSRLSNSNILINLIKNGRHDSLQELISLGADVNASEKGKSVLEYIIDVGDAKLIIQAIKAGANVNVRLPFHIKRNVVETAYSKFTRSRYSHGDKFNAFNVTTFDSEKKEFALEHIDNTAFDLDNEEEEKRQLVEDPTIFCRLCLTDDFKLIEEIIGHANDESLEKAFTLVLARDQIQMAKLLLRRLRTFDEKVLENMLYRALVEGKRNAYELILEALEIDPSKCGEFHVVKRAKMVLKLFGVEALEKFHFSRKSTSKKEALEETSLVRQIGNVTLVAVDDTDPCLTARCARVVASCAPDVILLPLNSDTVSNLLHSLEGLAQQSKDRFERISKISALERTPEEEMQRTYDYRLIQNELWPFREAISTVDAASKLEDKIPALVLAEPDSAEIYRKVSASKDRHKFEVYTAERLSDFASYSKTDSEEFRLKLSKTRKEFFPEANEAYYGTKRDFMVSKLREHCSDRTKACLCLVDVELFDSVCDAFYSIRV